MNYVTNYYKNLSEQLQQQVTRLEQLLEEADISLDPYYGLNTPTTVPDSQGFGQNEVAPDNYDQWVRNNPKPGPNSTISERLRWLKEHNRQYQEYQEWLRRTRMRNLGEKLPNFESPFSSYNDERRTASPSGYPSYPPPSPRPRPMPLPLPLPDRFKPMPQPKPKKA